MSVYSDSLAYTQQALQLIQQGLSFSYGAVQDYKNADRTEREITRQQSNIETDRAFAREQWEWNKSYVQNQNEIMRHREDTAIQRRTQDMLKAGINPLLAAGSPAQAQGVSAPSNVSGSGSGSIASPVTANARMDMELRLAEHVMMGRESEARVHLMEAQAFREYEEGQQVRRREDRSDRQEDRADKGQTLEWIRVGIEGNEYGRRVQRDIDDASSSEKERALRLTLSDRQVSQFITEHGLEKSRLEFDRELGDFNMLIQTLYLDIAEEQLMIEYADAERRRELHESEMERFDFEKKVKRKLEVALLESQNNEINSRIESIAHTMKLKNQENVREWIKLVVNSIATFSDVGSDWYQNLFGGKGRNSSAPRNSIRGR